MPRIRADQLLVQRGLAESRERAQRLIAAGRARVGTLVLAKPATLLDSESAIEVTQPAESTAPDRFVSRGGEKLQAALDHFAITVAGLRCLDIGASTGGFTDCLLQAGAASVLAIDVGHGQLHQRLLHDARVRLMEGTNARDLPALPGEVDFFVADLSFISLRKVLPAVASRIAPGTPGVVLLKPQFEAGPADVPRAGVIRDPAVRERVLAEFQAWAGAESWAIPGALECPVRGGEGNVEFLIHLSSPEAPRPC